MKHIKEFEKLGDAFYRIDHRLNDGTYVKKGDYICFNIEYDDTLHSGKIIKPNVSYKIYALYSDINAGIILCDNSEVDVNFHTNGIRKLYRKETKFLLDAEKYNL